MKLRPNRVQFLPHRNPPLEKARFAVIPVPYERTTSYMKGTAAGPDAVLKASPQLELWDEELGKETWREGILTLSAVDVGGGQEAFFKRLESYTARLLSSFKGVPFFIGGEHSVTQGLLPPFQRMYPDLSILHFDAHADLRAEYFGTPRSHACALYPASRISRTVQVGIRSVGHDERRRVDTGLVRTFLMHDNLDIARLEKKVLRALSGTVYMTIDVDGFDPSVMPGTGTPQPGGFAWHDALRLFRAVCREKKVVGIDLVEVSPLKGSPVTEFAAAKLLYRLMGYLS